MPHDDLVRYPVMQVRPFGLLVYDRIEYPPSRRQGSESSPLRNLKGLEAYSGYLTTGSRKRLQRAISIICAIAEPKTAFNNKLNREFKFRLNFITLTLPAPQGDIDDKTIKAKCLDVWLKAAKRRFKLRSYIWRAERQGNGNIHFHIVTDTYIPYDQLRDTWNDRLEALGFITRFEKKHGHRHPNSTDVHAIKNIRNLAAYFSKYMAKGERCVEDIQAQPPHCHKVTKPMRITAALKFKRILTREQAHIDGRLWDCSKNLKIPGNCEFLLEGDAEAVLRLAYADPEIRTKQTETCLLMFMDSRQFQKYITGSLLERYRAWLDIFRAPNENIFTEKAQKPPS